MRFTWSLEPPSRFINWSVSSISAAAALPFGPECSAVVSHNVCRPRRTESVCRIQRACKGFRRVRNRARYCVNCEVACEMWEAVRVVEWTERSVSIRSGCQQFLGKARTVGLINDNDLVRQVDI
jgi:hypothetical protein